MSKTFNEMIAEQTEKESFLESFLDYTISNTPIIQESAINESAILECDENGVFPDDDEDDEIDRRLGV